MKELTYLSPAETLLILDPAKSKAEELAKLTFLDLVMRKILALELKDASPTTQNKTKKLKKIVSVGTNFESYTPAKHEVIFLKPFAKDADLKISLRNLIKIAFEGIKSTDEYKLKYVYNRRISKYFSANLIQLLIGIKRINTKGLELQKRISDYLKSMDNELKSNKKNVDRLEERLLSLYGNILLLKNADNSVFKILTETDKKKTVIQNRDDLAWYDYGVMYMWSPHSLSSNFNLMAATKNTFSDSIESLDNFDSSGIDSTSVSGGSGCAGCGGCGGCGGCS